MEVYRQPSAEGYNTVEHHGRGGTVSPAAFPEVELSVSELLG